MSLEPRTFESEVSHLSNQGYGLVTSPEGQRFFVRGVWPRDRVRVITTEETEEHYAFAELLEVLSPSPERVPSPCPHAGLKDHDCGGCPWMIVAYPAQLDQKQHRISYALQRAGFAEPPLSPIWPAPQPLGYRSRAQFKTDGKQLGYAGKQGLAIAPIADCVILSPRMAEHLKALQARLPHAEWEPRGEHIWSFLDVDEDSEPADVLPNRRRAFQQAHRAQNERMQAWVHARLSRLTAKQKLLELFSGSGNFTIAAVEAGFTEIVALEVAPTAVAALEAKGWPQVQALRVDLYHPRFAQRLAQWGTGATTLLVNPPRAGLQKLAKAISQRLSDLQTILYISCDPGSLAQDLRVLRQVGFDLEEVQALDQMPHTPHIETMVRLERRSRKHSSVEDAH